MVFIGPIRTKTFLSRVCSERPDASYRSGHGPEPRGDCSHDQDRKFLDRAQPRGSAVARGHKYELGQSKSQSAWPPRQDAILSIHNSHARAGRPLHLRGLGPLWIAMRHIERTLAHRNHNAPSPKAVAVRSPDCAALNQGYTAASAEA